MFQPLQFPAAVLGRQSEQPRPVRYTVAIAHMSQPHRVACYVADKLSKQLGAWYHLTEHVRPSVYMFLRSLSWELCNALCHLPLQYFSVTTSWCWRRNRARRCMAERQCVSEQNCVINTHSKCDAAGMNLITLMFVAVPPVSESNDGCPVRDGGQFSNRPGQ